MKKLLIAVVLILTVSILLSGCTQAESNDTDVAAETAAATTEAPATSAETTAAATAAETEEEKDITIAGIVLHEDQYMRLVQLGYKDGAEINGVKILLNMSGGNIDKEIELINTYIEQGVDGIAIVPCNPEGSLPALQKAADKGIKIVASGLKVNGDIHSSWVENDNVELGSLTGVACREFIQEKLNGKAKIGALIFRSAYPLYSNQRYDAGFLPEVLQLPGVEIVAEQDAWLPEMGVQKGGDILTAHPDINILFAANEGGTVGSVMAVKNAGKEGKVFVFGTDFSEQIAGMLFNEDNVLQAVTTQEPYLVGTKSIDYLVAAINGDTSVPKKELLPGTLLSRDNPDYVQSYLDKLLDQLK